MDTSADLAELTNLLGIKRVYLLAKGDGRWTNVIFNNFLHYKKVTFLEKISKKKKTKPKKLVFNFDLKGLKDVTTIPFNGCRRWKYILKNKKRKNKDKDVD